MSDINDSLDLSTDRIEEIPSGVGTVPPAAADTTTNPPVGGQGDAGNTAKVMVQAKVIEQVNRILPLRGMLPKTLPKLLYKKVMLLLLTILHVLLMLMVMQLMPMVKSLRLKKS